MSRLYPGLKFNVIMADGAADAESFKYAASNNDGFWRAVLVRWYGVPLAIETPLYPPENEKPFQGIRAPKDCWCITGLDTFGVPIKAGVSGGTITVSLLDDQGAKWEISGTGLGVGAGVTIGPEIAEKGAKHLLNILREVGLKVGDLQNISATIKDRKLTGPNETGGAMMKGATWAAGLSINQITSAGWMIVASGEAQRMIGGMETGLISFGIPPGYPWGFYTSAGLGTLKAALGGNATAYKIEGLRRVS